MRYITGKFRLFSIDKFEYRVAVSRRETKATQQKRKKKGEKKKLSDWIVAVAAASATPCSNKSTFKRFFWGWRRLVMKPTAYWMNGSEILKKIEKKGTVLERNFKGWKNKKKEKNEENKWPQGFGTAAAPSSSVALWSTGL